VSSKAAERWADRLRQRAGLIITAVVVVQVYAAAQDDTLVRAREAAAAGRRADAIGILEARLVQAPEDVDARLLYGLVLSWEGRYDEARPVLSRVLVQAPDYTDARVALMNVEYWSGRRTEALELADQILTREPGNVTARAVRERSEAASIPWSARTDYIFDAFSDTRQSWHEASLALTRRTPVGPLILRGSYAERFGSDDELIQVEFYPRFRAGTYAYVEVGASTDQQLYPESRFSFDVYQSLGRGIEVSGGARFLDFDTMTKIYVGTVTKYLGNWMVTGKVFRVPAAEQVLDSTTYHGGVRRYYGRAGTSYVGFNYSHGLSREEVIGLSDLASLDADTVRAEFDHVFGTRLRLFVGAGTSRQELANTETLWQTTVSSGFSVDF
jgi:YaiO family outer membrane protein